MVAALKLCEGNLYSLFVDRGNGFSEDEFWSLHGLLDASHESIHLKWVCDLNSAGEAQVAFSVGGTQHWAVHEGQPVSRALWAQLVARVKDQCAAAASQLIRELRSRFPVHSVLDALGIVYPQYWAVSEAKSNFKKHLEVLKKFYCERKLITDGENKGQSVEPILDSWQLDAQHGYFKLAMLSNYSAALEPPFVLNPLTRLWRTLDAASVCVYPEYMKLARIAIVHVLGSVQDERCFSSLSFLKNKLRNGLDAHLQLVVGMYSQQCYTIQNFLYEECFDKWANAGKRYWYLLQD